MVQKQPPGRGGRSRATTEVDKRVGQNIRARRKDMHMTLAELAERLNVTHQQLQKYETGQNRVSASMIVDLTEALNVSIEDLFDGTGRQKGKKPDALETARRKCRIWVDRAQSADALIQMAGVLKAMAGKD